MPICKDTGTNQRSKRRVANLGGCQIIGRVVFCKRLTHIFDLIHQQPRSETGGVLHLVVNNISAGEQQRESFVCLQEAADLSCIVFEAGEIRVGHIHICMAS